MNPELVKLGPADGSGGALPSDPVRFEEAIEAFRQRVPMTDDEFDALQGAARARAFTVANVTQLEVVQDVWRAIDAAVSTGETFDDFKKRVLEKLEADWGGEKPGRLETIFRTNVQTAYGAGRVRQLRSPAVSKRRPYWKFSAVLDSRTSPICSECAGTVLAADNPWWSSHQPPLHFQCRSAILPLTDEQAKAAGVAESPPAIDADDGFGNVEAPETWEPDLSRTPAPLAKAFQAKAEARKKQDEEAQERQWPPRAPVSDALQFSPRSKVAEPTRQALAAIDKIHDDGVLPKIPVGTKPGRGALGSYTITLAGRAVGIDLKPGGSHPALTAVHEIGHFLDHQAIGKPGQFASVSHASAAELRKAIGQSDAVKRLRELMASGTFTYVDAKGVETRVVAPRTYLKYLLQGEELFARAYAQYVAERSGDAELLNGLADTRKSPIPTQWDAKDFEPISRELDKLFKDLGWLKLEPKPSPK